MKNLLYKELKLAMHPLIYVFMIGFPFLVLIPNYPAAASFLYIISAYPVLFLGANKGQQSNDIYYSCLLPIRKRDVVKARMMSLALIQLVSIALVIALSPLAMLVQNALAEVSHQPVVSVGIALSGIVSLAAIMLVGYSVMDFVFLPLFYRNGRSIVMSTLLGMIAFVTYVMVFAVFLPIQFPAYQSFFSDVSIWIQLIYLAVGVAIYFGLHCLIYRVSASLLEKVDL